MCPDPSNPQSGVPRDSGAARGEFIALVYDELRAAAHQYMAQRPGADALTLQPTALVHEVFLRLANHTEDDFNSRTHILAVAAVAMRHVLIDYARGNHRAKRGNEWKRITLTNALAIAQSDQIDFLELDESLTRLAEMDERAARVVELRFFGGMTEAEVAKALDVSERTVRNDWTMARAWLRRELGDDDEARSA